MNKTVKKILVAIPAIVISLVYLRAIYYEQYSDSGAKRITAFILSILLFYLWIFFVVTKKKQDNLLRSIFLSAFFVYVFAVLQLTGYFILFREISSQDWWGKMLHRIQINDRVNLIAFETMNRYYIFSKQIIGNAIMLLPLGFFLPLLNRRFRRFSAFFFVTLLSFLISVSIEILQLATNFRSSDIDDVILNTGGACAGYLIYQVVKVVTFKPGEADVKTQ